MCMKRDIDDTCEKLCRFQIRETIDLTIDELGETIDLTIDEFEDDNDFTEFTPRVDQLTYPYNLLPSSDEEEPVRGFISHMDESNDDIHYTNSNTIHDSSIEINQNANTPSASVNINLNISETNNTDQLSEDREFELNIPQILLSMSRISHNLYNLTLASHD